MTTRILIADAHEVTRCGLRILIEAHSGWSVCAEARTGAEAINYATALQPEVVALSHDLVGMNGLEAAPLIRRFAPKSKLLVVTAYNNEQWLREFIELGVRGYVLKSDAARSIVDAIEAVVNGHVFFSERLRAGTEPGDPLANPAVANRRLSRRELEVLTLLSVGRSNKEIGVTLGISTKTVETYRARLMQKLGAHSIAELVRYALRNRLVEQ